MRAINPAIAKICVPPDASLKTVLEVLQENPFGICLVTDPSSKVIGTITDGDCRRAFLRGPSLELTAQAIMHREFLVVDQTFSLDHIKTLMRTNGVAQVPVVNNQNQLVDLITTKTLYRPRERDTAVVILAGGRGRRLMPLTEAMPKPMLPINGRPMLERLVEQLVEHGLTNIYISINYLGHIIKEHFGDGSRFNCRIQYITETQELGTAGPLRALGNRATSPTLVVNGDLVTSVDFSACIDFHHSSRHDVTIAVSRYDCQVPFGVVTTNSDGIVTSIREKPTLNFSVNAGFYAIEPQLLNLIPEGSFFLMTDFLDTAMKAGHRIGAFAVHENWADVGLMDQYLSAQRDTA